MYWFTCSYALDGFEEWSSGGGSDEEEEENEAVAAEAILDVCNSSAWCCFAISCFRTANILLEDDDGRDGAGGGAGAGPRG